MLDGHKARHPRNVTFVRLLLLTGCRKDEIRTLQWSDYREGRLFLRDGKTGPRTVWLSSSARALLDGLPRLGIWAFPSPCRRGPISSMTFQNFWWRIREEAGLADTRLHDLRHTYASTAIMRGENVTTIGRLLGHNDPDTTHKYAHLFNRSVREASDALVGILGEH